MQIIHAIILGIVQGLTEFLPISSSAHLILVPWFLGWQPKGLAFDVALHVGTAVAVLAFFWKDWIHLFREALKGLITRATVANQSQKLFWLLVVGTLPAVIAGLALGEFVESHLRSPLITVFTLAGLAIALYLAERRSRQNRKIEHLNWWDSIWIGISQAAALIPGVSRSGITITAAMLRDCDRATAARFSFLLSTPVIVGAGVMQAWTWFKTMVGPGTETATLDWSVMAVGTACAALTGFLCIRFFLRYLQTKGFMPFILYRIAVAGIVLIYYLKKC